MSKFTAADYLQQRLPDTGIAVTTELEPLSGALQVCEAAGVPLEVVPLTAEYWDRVVSYSIAETRAGRTPNPDVLCNSRCDLLSAHSQPGRQRNYFVLLHGRLLSHAAKAKLDVANCTAPLVEQTSGATADWADQAPVSGARYNVGQYR